MITYFKHTPALIGLLCIVICQLLVSNINANDDTLYLILNAIRLHDLTSAKSLYFELLEVLENHGAPYFEANRGVFRFELRESYANNYLLVSSIQSFFLVNANILDLPESIYRAYNFAVFFSGFFLAALVVTEV